MMSAMSLGPAVALHVEGGNEIGCGGVRARHRASKPFGGLLGLVLLGALTLATAGLRDALRWKPPTPFSGTETVPAANNFAMPSTPIDGVLTLVIPAGASADQQAGGRGYEMPPVISLRVSDTIVIRSEDTEPHMILYAWVQPGATSERTFTAPGSEVYSSGCGLHAASFLNFTTIFVRE